MTPAVRHLMAVDVRSMVEWISAIPFEEWPQQHRLEDGGIRPAMVNDLDWPRGKLPSFWSACNEVLNDVLWEIGVRDPAARFRNANHMLSAVMPGHSIEPHADAQAPDWITRVHVPLMTSPWAFFDVFEPGPHRYQMEVGKAYMVDVSQVHQVRNNGPTPRIHFMFDVFGRA